MWWRLQEEEEERLRRPELVDGGSGVAVIVP